MIDHTLTFASEAAAIAALPEFRDGETWDESRTIPGVQIVVPAPDAAEPTYADGWSITIALAEPAQQLAALPECRCIRDRETGGVLYGAEIAPSVVFA